MNSTNNEYFDLERLKAISVVEVARRLGHKVWRAGVNYKMVCPWHDDHNPSLGLVTGTDKNFCHCYVCGKGGSTINLVMQSENWSFKDACQWLSDTFGVGTVTSGRCLLRPKEKPVEKEVVKEFNYIPMEMVDELVTVENSLCQCLMKMFRPEAVEWLVEEYRIGSLPMWNFDNCTVFPNIDHYGRVCNLKVQHYDTDPASQQFGHSQKNQCYMLAAIWKSGGKLPKDGCYEAKCLFGEHLLDRYPDCIVALVESPKNALYGALAFPKMVWVATGNKTMLQRKYLMPLRGRDIIVIPDADAVKEWADAVDGMKDLANFTVSDFCERMAPADQPKFDIADYIQQERMALVDADWSDT